MVMHRRTGRRLQGFKRVIRSEAPLTRRQLPPF